jgi:hypothetical protein
MSYAFQLVAFPLERLAALYASRDEALFQRVLHTPGYVQTLLDRHAPGEASSAMESALLSIFLGGATRLQPHKLGYALEACCFALGQPLGAIDSRHVERVDAMLDRESPTQALALFPGVDSIWPMPLWATRESEPERGWPSDPALAEAFPRSGPGYGFARVRDYPMSGHLTAADVSARKALLDRLPASPTEPYTSEEIALSTARQVFDDAAAAGCDVIVFFH